MALLLALVPSIRTNTTEPDYNASTTSASSASEADIETYYVEQKSSSPFMSDIGSGIVSRLVHPPYDASVLEEAAANPTYDAVKENVVYHQPGVGSFITFLWAAMVFFCLITLGNTLHRAIACGTGEFRQRVTPSYMAFFVFLLVVLGVLFVLMTLLLLCLVTTRDSMVDSVTEKVPAVLASTFNGLRGFVNLTVAQIALNRRTARMPKVGKVLGDGFDTAFKSFVASSATADVRIPLYHGDQECATDKRYFGSIVNTRIKGQMGDTFKPTENRCTHFRRDQEQLFGDVSRAVAAATRNDRQKIYQVLSDYASMMDESDCNVLPSHNSINQLENDVHAFEDSKGAFKSLATFVESDLFWVVILHVLSLCLLIVGMLMGVCVHNSETEPYERSQLSHLIGCELTLTAYAFTLFVIVAIWKSMFLVIGSTLGYTYFCEPYLTKNYVILDDALERLWPASNRSHLLSRITPTEVMVNCQNDSVSVLDLGPKPSHGRTSNREGVFLPRLNLKNVLREFSSHPRPGNFEDSFSRYADLFASVMRSSQNSLSAPAKYLKGNRNDDLGLLAQLLASGTPAGTGFWHSDKVSMLDKAAVERALLPIIPSYYNRFVEGLVNIVTQPKGSSVAGRCSILRALFTSFMDVVCYTYVLEFVAYWASLLLATFLALLTVPFCFMLAKYFFRCKRPIRVLRRARSGSMAPPPHGARKRRSLESEQLEREETSEQYQGDPLARLLQMYSRAELPPGMTRRIVAMSTKGTTIMPPFGPPMQQLSSFSSRLTQTPKRFHAVSSSTSIATGGVPVMAGIPTASMGAMLATPSIVPSLLPGPFVGAAPSHAASSSMHRANSLTMVQSEGRSRFAASMASSSHQLLAPHPQMPLMYATAATLPSSQPVLVAPQPMRAVCVPVQASGATPTRMLQQTTVVGSTSQLNLAAPSPPPAVVGVMATSPSLPSATVYHQAYPAASYALPTRVAVAPALAAPMHVAPVRRTTSVQRVYSSSNGGFQTMRGLVAPTSAVVSTGAVIPASAVVQTRGVVPVKSVVPVRSVMPVGGVVPLRSAVAARSVVPPGSVVHVYPQRTLSAHSIGTHVRRHP